MKKKFFLITLLFACVFCGSCELPNNSIDNDEIPILQTNKDYLEVGYSTYLKITNYDTLELFTISVSDETILTVDEWYRINAKSAGIATIYATLISNPKIVGELNLEIISTAPSLFLSNDIMEVGMVSYIGIRNWTGIAETGLDDFTFSSSNPDIITIDNHKVIANRLGEATLTAVSKLNEKVTQSIDVLVVDGTVRTIITLPDYQGSIASGAMFNLELSGDYDFSQFTLSTSNREILRISVDGRLVAIKEGITFVNIYEIGNPDNRSSLGIEVKGVLNVDYVSRLIDIAGEERGYVEGPNNDTKYGKWYPDNYNPWCAMFVSWCWFHAGLSNDLLLKYEGCQTGMNWCLEKGIFHYKKDYKPVSGDIVFFLSSGSSHTGIVVWSDSQYVYTIEGNASNKVDYWRWSLNDARITGYAHPDYPVYDGTTADYSWIATKQENDKYLWTAISEKHEIS